LRKEFTSFDVAAVVRELKEKALNSHVNNIYQLDNKTLLLKLHKADGPSQDLILEAGRRLHLTSYVMEKPPVPPSFCMALRKYIRNARLTSLEQHEFERVVTLDLKAKDRCFRLILEFFGDGNIVLLDENGRILQALVYKRMRDRSILRNESFQFAPASGKNPLKMGEEEMWNELKASGKVEVVRVLARRLGVGGTYAEETLLRAGVDKNKTCDEIDQAEAKAMFEGLRGLLARVVEGNLEPSIVSNADGDFVDVSPFRLRRYENSGFKYQPCDSFNEALDEFYTKVVHVEKALTDLKVDQLGREAERLNRIIQDQQSVLAKAEADADESKSIGDIIYAHSAEFSALLERFSSGKQRGKDWETITAEVLAERKAGMAPSVFFEAFDSRTLMVNVIADVIHFSLNIRRSLFENAAEFYEKSKRARQKFEGANAALKETREKLANIEAKMSKAEALEHVRPTEALEELRRRKVKRKEWFEKFRWFTSSDEFLVVAGKDAVSNEVLIKKHCGPEDIVFHAEVVGAPFVVVKADGRQPSEQVLKEAAEFAAAYSRGWREGFASVDVYWVKPEQLGKAAPPGQYVSRGAFVVSGKRNWKRNVQLRVAVGVLVEKDGVTSFVGGPLDPVRVKTQTYVIVVPGGHAGKRLLDHVLKTLAEKMPKDQRQLVLKSSIEEIRELIPYGVGEVLIN
jgi:predicted ribosome quality control (RQC) complex YloA/Tae2 family protein